MAKIIQITKDDINGLIASVVTKTVMDRINEVESFNWPNSCGDAGVRQVIAVLEKYITDGVKWSDNDVISISYLNSNIIISNDVEFIAVLDITISQSTSAKIVNYNKKAQDNGMPMIYICNSWSNNLYLPTYVTVNGIDDYSTVAERWLKFIIAKYSPKLSKGLLKCLMEVSSISPTHKLKQSGEKRNNGKVIKTTLICLSLYGFDAYGDMLAFKYLGTEKIAPSKNESYIAHNFGRYVIEKMAADIEKNQIAYDPGNTIGNVAFINVDHFNIWALTDALKMANENAKKEMLPVIYAVIAMDSLTENDIHIRRIKDDDGKTIDIGYSENRDSAITVFSENMRCVDYGVKKMFTFTEVLPNNLNGDASDKETKTLLEGKMNDTLPQANVEDAGKTVE